MIIWVNGAFGAGKTTLADELGGHLPDAVLFDPEYVGYILQRWVPVPTGDFQDLPSWRELVIVTAARVPPGTLLLRPGKLTPAELAARCWPGCGTRQADSRTTTQPGAGDRSPASRPRMARAAWRPWASASMCTVVRAGAASAPYPFVNASLRLTKYCRPSFRCETRSTR